MWRTSSGNLIHPTALRQDKANLTHSWWLIVLPFPCKHILLWAVEVTQGINTKHFKVSKENNKQRKWVGLA